MTGCRTAATVDRLCSWHDEYGRDAGNARAWRSRVRRLYLVWWPQHGAFKVGVEATAVSRRITKWVASGAEVVAVWELTDETSGEVLAEAETHIVGVLRAAGLPHPTHKEWLPVVGPGMRADGRSETFLGDVTAVQVEKTIDEHLAGQPVRKTAA